MSMSNEHIAATFDQLADLLELKGENPFRVRAYRNAARAIRDLERSIESMLAEGHDLTDIDGIGEAVAKKCQQLVQTGRLEQMDELLTEVPVSLLQLTRIEKLGPKKVWALYQELGIETLDQLREACQQGRVRDVKGFSAKSEQAILQGLPLAESAVKRLYWGEADVLVQQLREHFQACEGLAQIEFAGSYRRLQETVGDIDILIEARDDAAIMDHFATWPEIESILGRGPTKMSVRTNGNVQVDLRVVPHRSFGAALQYFTGSKQHNVQLRSLAKQRDLKINEYGVFRISGQEELYIAGATEQDVYAALDLPLFPPELREARHEFRWAQQGALPELVKLSDIRGDLHMHTTDSDGRATITQMALAARQRGLSYIAITDHSPRVAMARGLDAQRLKAQWREIDRLRDELNDIFVLKGVECDILEEGRLDLPDDVLAEADWVTASIHYGQNQSRQQITQRIIGAIEHPYVSAISHPTGRLINRRKPYEVDLEAVMNAARRCGKLLELNASPSRLDLDDVQCAIAKSLGILIVINTDAHSVHGLDDMRYGINQARRGGLTAGDVANSRPWNELKRLIGASP